MIKNLIGLNFGRLKVVRQSDKRNQNGSVMWLCKCSCGNTTLTSGHYLVSGDTRSCGCLRRELNKIKAKNNRIHGENAFNSRLYRIWQNMKGRCRWIKHKSYGRYGGRGIIICPNWSSGYLQFRTWALTHGYQDDLTIHRINNNGNYEPVNCCWITRAENTRLGIIERSRLAALKGKVLAVDSGIGGEDE